MKDVLNFKFIRADRGVSNAEPDKKTLSVLSSRIYDCLESDEGNSEIEKFKDALVKTDNTLGGIYNDIFKETVEKVRTFGGINPNDTSIKICSSLQHKDLLKNNTIVTYSHGDVTLPENYNGLGYMNLISIIFEIEIKMNEFKRTKLDSPADINLLFIEEPEAHTHPQMQYVFIRNIKGLLQDRIRRDDGREGELQYIITTHSSHIVSESDFDDIKYMKICDSSVVAKNLRDLETDYQNDNFNGDLTGEQAYKFLKQYLTLNRSELFFADKAILVEGDTERILLPAIMKKIDMECVKEKNIPLLSQNISIVETGNYSYIFEKFISFLGIKTLIITDIDSSKKSLKKCRVDDPDVSVTTNNSLKFFYGTDDISILKSKDIKQRILLKDLKTKKWVTDLSGYVMCNYQTKEENSEGNEYYARSFEDSFLHLNRQFVIDNKDGFLSLKNKSFLDEKSKDVYSLALKCISKKPTFAIEILLNSELDEKNGNYFTNWNIPSYIKEGLLWLKEG